MSEAAESPTPVADSAGPPSKLGAKLGKKRGRRLANIAGVKACLADVIRSVENDTMEPGKARCMIYGLSTLAGVVTGHDLEQRIKELMEATK